MLCPSCAAEIHDGDAYCGKCGANTNEIHDLKGRLSTVEAQVKTVERLDQQRLEIDTAANAMERVRKWMTLLFFFVGLPVVATGIFVAVVWGKGGWDIHTIAANATQEIQTLGEKTKKDASDTKQQIHEASESTKKEATQTKDTVDDALKESRQVASEVKDAKNQVDKLRSDVTLQSNDLKTLGTQVAGVKSELELSKKAASQIRQDVKEATQEKAVMEATQRYPLEFGKHYALSSSGSIVARKDKASGAVWVVITLYQSIEQSISPETFVGGVAAVKARYKVWEDYVSLVSGTPGVNTQNLGAFFDFQTCTLNGQGGTGLTNAPCILYFNESMKSKALEIRDLLKPVQFIPDDRVKYMVPEKLTKPFPELVDLSGIDVVVVLGK
jgi:hypothetical protein